MGEQTGMELLIRASIMFCEDMCVLLESWPYCCPDSFRYQAQYNDSPTVCLVIAQHMASTGTIISKRRNP